MHGASPFASRVQLTQVPCSTNPPLLTRTLGFQTKEHFRFAAMLGLDERGLMTSPERSNLQTKIPVVDRNSWLVAPEELEMHIPQYFERCCCDGMVFAWAPDGRFMDDRVFAETDDWFLLLDGVILNKAELFNQYEVNDAQNMLQKMLRDNGVESTLSKLRGPFSGAFLDRKTGQVHLYVNQTGDTAAFLFRGESTWLATNSLDLTSRILQSAKIPYTFSERAARMMLSFGYMTDETTFIQEMKRVLPATFVAFSRDRSSEMKTVKYWELKYEPAAKRTLDEHIEIFDQAFRHAVKREFEKDVEYGYRTHLADISAGMDCRMTNFVAKALGYEDITNITYNDSRSTDAKSALEASRSLGNDCLFYPLDDGNCLLEPESFLRLNSGAANYAGITGGKAMLERLNFDKLGLEHTGQLGGYIGGSSSREPRELPADPKAKMSSRLHFWDDLANINGWQNYETHAMGVRGFLGTVSTHLLRRHFTWAVAPFLDVEVLEASFSIPVELRFGHQFYEAWVAKCHPDALKTPTSRLLPSQKRPVPRSRKIMKTLRGWTNRARIEIGMKPLKKPGPTTDHMNPFHLWLKENKKFAAVINDAKVTFSRQVYSEELQSALTRSFSDEGTPTDHLLAVTVITMRSLYFGTNDDK